MPPIIQIQDAVIYRFQQKVLGPVSYSFEKGVNYMLSGHNGVGKTSLLQAIKGIVPLRSGSINFLIDNKHDIYEWKRQNIVLVSFADTDREFLNKQRYYQQRFHAFDTDDFTVEEYLTRDGFNNKNSYHHSIIENCGLQHLMSVNRIKLSSGQSRKFLIARALLKEPAILLLDNPYVGLDKENRQVLNNLIDELTGRAGIQFIMAGQYTLLPKSVEHIFELKFEECKNDRNNIPDCLVHYFAEIAHWPTFNTVLDLHNINVSYTDKSILYNLRWTIKKGDKWSLIGQNGSGKSTLIGLIAADHPQAYKNDVSLFDEKRSHKDSIWDIKRNIGLVSSELHSYFHDPQMSCFSIVKQGLYETIYNNKSFSKTQENAIHSLFTYFRITHFKHKLFQYCSTGEQRLILFLRAIIKNPPLLLLDEPFQVLDTIQVERAKHLLEHILTPHHTLIFITHFTHEIPDNVEHSLRI